MKIDIGIHHILTCVKCKHSHKMKATSAIFSHPSSCQHSLKFRWKSNVDFSSENHNTWYSSSVFLWLEKFCMFSCNSSKIEVMNLSNPTLLAEIKGVSAGSMLSRLYVHTNHNLYHLNFKYTMPPLLWDTRSSIHVFIVFLEIGPWL